MTNLSPDNPRMKRVRLLTMTMIVLTALFFARWNFQIFSWMIPFVFGSGIQDASWVDDGVIITFGQRATYLMFWAVTILLSWFTFYAAFRMLATFRKGAFFEVSTCRKIQVFGAGLVGVIVSDTVLTLVTMPILTADNPVDGKTGNVGPSLVLGSSEITLVFCGVGFFILGWVFHEGVQIAEDNKGFV
jgi:hypothetical protein